MFTLVFWSGLVQFVLSSLTVSAVLGTWAQVVTRARHRERMQQAERQHQETLAAVRPIEAYAAQRARRS
ncbi:MAG TPA: hypothetical protein VFT75_18350 [Nocardioidaceae bacterium]|nr:hypothetical protein [Nocardioidaceae bacterium]